MAAGGLGDDRLGSLGHGALGGRRDHVVVRGDQVPGRLAAPGRLGDRTVQAVHTRRDLGVGHERGQLLWHVGGEGGGELVPVQEQEPVDRRQDRRRRRVGRSGGDQRADRLARVGRERGDVNERGDTGVVAGLGDDGSAVGMADQHGRAIEAVENRVRGGDVAAEGEGGVLHDGDPVTVGGEVVVDALPARPVREVAVYQHDVLDCHGHS